MIEFIIKASLLAKVYQPHGQEENCLVLRKQTGIANDQGFGVAVLPETVYCKCRDSQKPGDNGHPAGSARL